MTRKAHADTIAHDLRIEPITIPASSSANATIASLVSGLKQKSWWPRVIAWEIVENDAEFEVTRIASGAGVATASAHFSQGAQAGFAPPVGKESLDSLLVRAAADATVSAVLVLYEARQDAEV